MRGLDVGGEAEIGLGAIVLHGVNAYPRNGGGRGIGGVDLEVAMPNSRMRFDTFWPLPR